MSSQSSTALPSVGETLGALYVGVTIAAVLYGVTNLQSVIYYRRFPNDWWVYRYSVGFLWALDTVHVVLSVYTVYFFLIHFFGDLKGALQYHSWSQKWHSFLNDFLVVYIQGLYALRLWRLGRNFHKSLVCFISLTVMATLGTAIYVAYDTYATPNFASASSIRTSFPVFFSTITVADLTIAIPTFYYLCKSRAIIRVPSTATVLLRLMRLVFMSGLATSVCSLLAIITYIAWPKSLTFLGIHLVLSKLYINSLLAMLNSRSKHHSANNATEIEANSLHTVLRITPHSPESDISETNISVPLSDINSVNHELGPSKDVLESRV